MTLNTIYGQFLDNIRERSNFSSIYNFQYLKKLYLYKSTYYFVYFPFKFGQKFSNTKFSMFQLENLAFIIPGRILFLEEIDEDEKNILINFGALFSYINDFNDCFGDSRKTGKIGTDIESGKICFPIVIQLENFNNIKIFREYYGFDGLNKAFIKFFYDKFNLNRICRKYIMNKIKELKKEIDSTKGKSKEIFGSMIYLSETHMK